MKETINHYYNLNIDMVDEEEGRYHFLLNRMDYYFIFYNRDINELDDIVNCSRFVKEKGLDCHNIILNIFGGVLTKVADYNYILFCVSNKDEVYDIVDMIEMKNKLVLTDEYSKLYRNNWGELWSKKVDYFEYQIRELGINRFLVLDTFSYYIGLAENAISYVNKTTMMYQRSIYDKLVLSHRRVFYPNTKLNYFNPLSFVFDLEVRDVAEYIKAMFFSETEEDVFLELETYLKINKLTNYSYQMLYARLLYPSYYFDLYDEVMNNDKDQSVIMKVIDKVDEYELFLKKAYLEISKYANIEKIDWIIDQH